MNDTWLEAAIKKAVHFLTGSNRSSIKIKGRDTPPLNKMRSRYLRKSRK